MTPAELKLLRDPSLSDAARVLGLYIASLGPGGAEVSRDDFRRLLYGAVSKDRVARELGQLELYGYVERKKGGREHSDHFRFSVQVAAVGGDSVSTAPTLSPDSVPEAPTLKRPSSPPTPTPPPDARVREDDIYVERLRVWLGGQRGVIERFAGSANHGPHWARDIWASYRAPGGEPGDGGGTEWAALFAGEDEETAVRAVVNAMQDYAGEGKPFDLKLFRGFVRSSMREIRKADRAAMEEPLARTGTDAPDRWPAKRGPQPHDAQEYKPTGFRGFNG